MPSKLDSNLELSLTLKQSRVITRKEFTHIIDNINSEEVLTIFKEHHLTKIDDIISMHVSELRNISITPTGQYENRIF